MDLRVRTTMVFFSHEILLLLIRVHEKLGVELEAWLLCHYSSRGWIYPVCLLTLADNPVAGLEGEFADRHSNFTQSLYPIGCIAHRSNQRFSAGARPYIRRIRRGCRSPLDYS